MRGKRGRPRRRPDVVLGDRGYDHDKYRRPVWDLGVKPLIARRSTGHCSGLLTQRWGIKRAFAHLHWSRRLRIRWEIRDDIHIEMRAEKKVESYVMSQHVKTFHAIEIGDGSDGR